MAPRRALVLRRLLRCQHPVSALCLPSGIVADDLIRVPI